MFGSLGHAKDAGKIPCVVCEKLFRPKVANQLTCCDKCKKINKANRDKARKAKLRKKKKSVPAPVKKGDKFTANGKKFVCVKGGKKPVAKKITEKVPLPPPPAKKPDCIILVRGNDPYKKFGLALQIAFREFCNILATTQHPVVKITTKKAK